MARREGLTWAAVGLVALAARLAYVAAQPGVDPTFARPMLDEAVYVGWARGLAAGLGHPPGAFYLAPLYPTLLASWAWAEAGFGSLYLAQQALAVAAAGLLAWTARGVSGPAAGLAAGVLALGYHPFLFFASRPLGETVAVALLAGSLAAGIGSRGPGFLAGTLAGLGALARPNLAPVTLAWSAGWPRRAAWILAGAAVAIVPVAARNWAASGHVVPISSNGGITLYHGNGPGALGIYTPPEGFTGRVDRQREEAVRLASAAARRPMDAVEADAWWGRRALETRLQDLAGTLGLLGRRAALLASAREIGLDAAPALDANPWRYVAPVPFAALLALAAAAVAGLGFARSGGKLVWGAAAVCAAMPLAFYASSRYRLPLAAVLSIPAGIGAAGALGLVTGFRARPAAIAGAVALAVSLLAPAGELARAAEAAGLSNRAAAWISAGKMVPAAEDVARALALDPSSGPAWFHAGVLAEKAGDLGEAEQGYRRALAAQPALTDAAGNLGSVLVRAGRAGEAVPVLEAALAGDPANHVCWTNLVVALLAGGRAEEAAGAAARAALAGVRLDPGLQAAVAAGGRS